MRLESIEIKGMHRIGSAGKIYQFNDTNYLTGPNGTGKSTILQAIQLVLLGYIPGTNKASSAIFGHACEPTMSVCAVISNDSEHITITRTYTMTKTGVTSSCTVTPDSYVEQNIAGWLGGLEVPIFDFEDFMGMTANKLKEWFIGFLPKSATSADWTKIFVDTNMLTAPYTEEVRKKLLGYSEQIKTLGIEGVIKMNDFAKATSAATKADLDRVMATLQQLTFYDDVDMATVSFEQAQSELNQAQVEQIRLNSLLQKLDQRKRIQQSIDALQVKNPELELVDDPEYQSAQEKRTAAQTEAAQISTEYAQLGAKIVSLEAEIQTLERITKSKGICPFTRAACDTVGTLVEKYSHEIYAKRDEIKVATARRSTLTTQNNFASEAYRSANRVIADMELNRTKYNTLIQQLPATSTIDYDATQAQIVAIKQTIQDKTNLLVKIRANEKYNDLADTMRTSKATKECEIEYLKGIIRKTSAAGLQSQLAEGAFGNFSEEMTAVVKSVFGDDAIQAKFNLVEKANSFSVGLIRNNRFVSYDFLSSGEKCLFTFSLVTTLIKVSGARLPLFLLDDLVDHLDVDNAKSFFTTLGNKDLGNVQLILAGVQPYTGNHHIVIDVDK